MIPGQTYTDPVAVARLRDGKCPECGRWGENHSGWGGANCTLTDNGVAQRIETQRQIDSEVTS